MIKQIIQGIIVSLLVCLITSCASRNNIDPYEKFNRTIFVFNTKIDHWIIRPTAKTYNALTPIPIQKGVTNFFYNISTITTIPNDILQAKFSYALSDSWRLLINSTIGVGGLFDVATRLNLPKHSEDFGLTIAYWTGHDQSTYLFLPLLGPYTFRDAVGSLADYVTSPWPYIQPHWIPYAALGIYTVSVRASLLPADKLVEESFDPYIFVRDAYLQKRQHAIEENKKPYPIGGPQKSTQRIPTASKD